MIITRIYPIGDGRGEASIDLEDGDAKARLTALYEPPGSTWLRLNLIASVNGSVVGTDSTSESLTNRADRTILGVIRRLADVVLVGAGSVRAEGYRVPRTARLAILTASGDLDGHRLADDVEPGRVLVICPGSAVASVTGILGSRVEVVALPDVAGRIDPALVVGFLRDRGLNRIVCEGGPALAGQLVAARLVDELCLTTAPELTDSRIPLLGDDAPTASRLTLTQLLADGSGSVYARWAISR